MRKIFVSDKLKYYPAPFIINLKQSEPKQKQFVTNKTYYHEKSICKTE